VAHTGGDADDADDDLLLRPQHAQRQALTLLTPTRTLRGHQESVTSLQIVAGSTGGLEGRQGWVSDWAAWVWVVKLFAALPAAGTASLGA